VSVTCLSFLVKVISNKTISSSKDISLGWEIKRIRGKIAASKGISCSTGNSSQSINPLITFQDLIRMIEGLLLLSLTPI